MKIRPRYITPFAIFSVALFTSVAVLFAIGAAYAPFADFLNGTVCHATRVALSYLTSPLPFSLFEMLLYLAPTLVTFAVLLGVSKLGDKWRTVRFLSGLLSLVFLFFSLYTLTLGIAYRTSSLSKRLSIKEETVNAEVLYRTGTVLLDTLAEDLDEIDYAESGSSIMPYSLDRLSEKILEAYDGVEARFGILKNFKSRAKPIYASEAMSHLELLGIYSPTGESNVNVDYPDYNLPFTVAHEFAHQRGIAREDEANFVAFLVCMQSDDPFIRYSGCLNMYVHLTNALYRTDKELYRTLLLSVDERVTSELRAEREHIKKYDIEWIGAASNALNDTYLKMNGTEGTVSYGLVVRLLVSYLLEKT